MYNKLLFFILMIWLCASAFAESDSCSVLADLKSKSDSHAFVGFGAGISQKEADENAQIDLARTIRQKVSSTSTVIENTETSNLESSSKSVVSEILIGAKVIKRCSNKENFSTVVSLDKTLFLSSLEKKLSYNVAKAHKLVNGLKNNQDEALLAQNVDAAKKFISDYQSNFESDLELCKIYNGCLNIKDEHVFSDLTEIVSKQGDKDQYVMITDKDEVTQNFRDELIDLIEREGFKVMDGAVHDDLSSINRKIFAKCRAKMGSKIPGTSDSIVETTCTLEAYNGKQKTLRKVYSCKALADEGINYENAMVACSGRLQ